MLRKNYNDSSFDKFLSVFENKQTYNRKYLAIPWRNGLVHHHFYCDFCLFSLHFDTFIPIYAKRLKEVLDEFK